MDLLLIETAFDTRNIKAGLLAIQRLRDETWAFAFRSWFRAPSSAGAPCWPVSRSMRSTHRSIHADLLAIGLNCATGPDLMTDHIRTLAEMASTRISCYPNAGLPNEEDKYLETPEIAGRRSSTNLSSTAG